MNDEQQEIIGEAIDKAFDELIEYLGTARKHFTSGEYKEATRYLDNLGEEHLAYLRALLHTDEEA